MYQLSKCSASYPSVFPWLNFLDRSCRFPLLLLCFISSPEHPMSCLKYFLSVPHFCTHKIPFSLKGALVFVDYCWLWYLGFGAEVLLSLFWEECDRVSFLWVQNLVSLLLLCFSVHLLLSWAWEKLEQSVVCTDFSIPLVGGCFVDVKMRSYHITEHY